MKQQERGKKFRSFDSADINQTEKILGNCDGWSPLTYFSHLFKGKSQLQYAKVGTMSAYYLHSNWQSFFRKSTGQG